MLVQDRLMICSDNLNSALRNWLQSELVVVDVGARWGIGDRWAPFAPYVTVFGFDPDEEECARLNASAASSDAGQPSVHYVPLALGSVVGSATLYLTREPACSSLYPPRKELLKLRPDLSVIEPAGIEQVSITTFDTWARSVGRSHFDAFKLDTQGSELGVLEGATEALASVKMIEVEVEFNEIYEGQPLFSDVDRFLRGRGFVLWRLQQLVHYGFGNPQAKSVSLVDQHFFDSEPVEVAGRGGQLFWGHAYFVPRHLAFPDLKQPKWDEAVRAACAAAAFGFTDLALSILANATGAPEDALPSLRRA